MTQPPAAASSAPVAVELRGLSVTAGQRELLNGLNAVFPAGRISVIVGPSGVGKSILLRIIAGLIRNRYDGVRMKGAALIGGEPARPGMAGVVFQSFALFDELSPRDNIEFARRCGRGASEVSAHEWLERMGLPDDVPTSRLSGGQRQRLAVARTLAYDPPLVLYDEPTSGLDPSTAGRVAGLIRETHQRFGKTSIIVTHDYPSLLPVADHVFLFDAETRTVTEIPRAGWETLEARLDKATAKLATVPAMPAKKAGGVKAGLRQFAEGFFGGTTDVLASVGIAVASLVPTWKNPVWGLRFLWHYLLLVCGPTAILYLLMAGFINGYVSTFFTFEFFPFATYTEPLLIEDLLEAIGFVLYREFVPILACILIAARCGAAVTADVGGRQYGSQLDAMSSFGAAPRAYLLTGIMLVFLFGTPLLSLLSWYGARTASVVAFVWSHPERGPNFWEWYFHIRLKHPAAWMYDGAWWMLAKTAVSGLGIGAIAWHFGVSPKYSASDVSRAVTRTILWATILVLAVHFVFALFEFESLRHPPPVLAR